MRIERLNRCNVRQIVAHICYKGALQQQQFDLPIQISATTHSHLSTY